jgi:hypothetical protein
VHRIPRRVFRRCLVSAALVGAPLVGVAVTVQSASANSPLTVSNNSNDGGGSLRAAIIAAEGAGDDTITVNPGVGTIQLKTPISFTMNGNLTIGGNGVAIDANGQQSALHSTQGSGNFSFDDFTVSGAHSTTIKSGAIVTEATGNVTLSNCTVASNTANAPDHSDSAAVTMLGTGNFTVNRCTFANNTMTAGNNVDSGGALDVEGGPATVTDSAFTANKTTGGTNAVLGGAIDTEGGPLTITNTSIAQNTVVSGDGGDAAGGVVSEGGEMTVTNSTISGNQGSGNGKPDNAGGGIVQEGGDLTLVYATISGNVAPLSDSTRATQIKNDGGALNTFGSVIGPRNAGIDDCVQDGGPTNSHGYNFTDDDSCGINTSTDITNKTDPGLGALGLHSSGERLVQLPQSGSAVLDAIPQAHCKDDGASGISTDERGVSRPQRSACDMGAVELSPADASTTTTTSPGTGSTGTAEPPTAVSAQPTLTG